MHSPDSIKILILWTVTPSLIEAFHAAFYSFPPPLGGHRLVGSFILSTALDGSTALNGLAQVWSPLFLHFRTQAISQHSWASLDIPCRINLIQDVDGIQSNIYLQISDFGNRTRAARFVEK